MVVDGEWDSKESVDGCVVAPTSFCWLDLESKSS